MKSHTVYCTLLVCEALAEQLEKARPMGEKQDNVKDTTCTKSTG